jgi:hypothetical protein
MSNFAYFPLWANQAKKKKQTADKFSDKTKPAVNF